MVRNKHDIDYHHQAEYVFSNGGIFANIASSYMKAVAQNPPVSPPFSLGGSGTVSGGLGPELID
jgi:hypothetical protein